MKPVDWIILGIVLLALGAAAFLAVRKKKRGGACCGSCAGCALSDACGKKRETEEKTADKQNDL